MSPNDWGLYRFLGVAGLFASTVYKWLRKNFSVNIYLIILMNRLNINAFSPAKLSPQSTEKLFLCLFCLLTQWGKQANYKHIHKLYAHKSLHCTYMYSIYKGQKSCAAKFTTQIQLATYNCIHISYIYICLYPMEFLEIWLHYLRGGW